MASRQLFEFSVYTIVHKNKLDEAATSGGTITVREDKAWTTGYDLFCKAKATGAEMPVIFADATDCSRLLYRGILTEVVIEDQTTKYSVKQMQEINGSDSPQELLLKSTGKQIAPNFICSYAICRTPSFLAKAFIDQRDHDVSPLPVLEEPG